jgi:mannose-1-phosphate guanylyltransferase
MLGIEPDEADPELGYILPSHSDGHGSFSVSQFIEKPSLTHARNLIDRGALWNAFILAAAAQTFLDLYVPRYAQLLLDMRAAVSRDLNNPTDAIAASTLYERLPELDFSRHVVEGAESILRVLPVPACGWSDLGTPKRVGEALHRLSQEDAPAPSVFPGSYLCLAAQHARLQMAG